MKSILSFLICVFACTFATAQVCGTPAPSPAPTSNTGSATAGTSGSASFLNGSELGSLRSMKNAIFSGQYATASASYGSIKGTPYLTKAAVNGQLIMNNGNVIDNVPLQYDTYANEVVATNEKGEEIVLDTRFYKEMVMPIDGEDVVFKKVNPDQPDKFFEVLYDDRGVVFYKENLTRLKEGKNVGVAKTDSRFRGYSNYYLKQGDEGIAKVNLKKKDVLQYFPQLEAIAMEEYCKKKGIKLKKEADFVAMFEGME